MNECIPERQTVIKRKLPPVAINEREQIEEFLTIMLEPLERSLTEHKELQKVYRSERIAGQIQYMKAQVSTINWLIQINKQRR